MIVVENAHANPPVSGRAGEMLNLGGVIAASEVVGKFAGGVFVGESADLHCPSFPKPQAVPAIAAIQL